MAGNFQIVVDESVDHAVVTSLKESGFLIFAVAEEAPSIPDRRVLEIACINNALPITEDKDFGELVYRFQLEHSGILLIRMIEAKSIDKAIAVTKAIKIHFDNYLTVLVFSMIKR